MIKIKKLLSFVLCIVLCASLSITAFAATSNTSLKVSTVTALPGDTVVINIEISNNPGIMAMAFCITYDNNSLVYKTYEKGYLSNYTIKDHPDKGHVSFVNVENKDVSTNGKIISLTFEVKSDAKPGKHIVSIANSNRDKYGTKLHNIFSDSKQNFVVPTAKSGGVVIEETCENSGHKYGGWTVVRDATCTEDGLQKRVCSRCSIVEEVAITAAHDFEADWTIDKAATPQEDGIMSRHCTRCEEVTDKITFSYEEIGGDDNSSNEDGSSEDTSSDASENGSDESSDNDSTNTSSDSVSSNDTPSNDPDANNTSSEISGGNKPNKKPVINNTVGEKVPLKEAEKFEDYQQNIKPNLNGNDTSDKENTSSKVESSKTEDTSSDITTGVTENVESDIPQEKEPSFFATPSGVIMIVICSLLSVGIIALGVILIMRNNKPKE